MSQKPTGRTSSMAKGVAIGVITSIMVTILSAGILAKLVEKEVLSEDKIGYGVLVILMLGSYLAGKIAWSKTKRRRLMTCALTGGIYFGALLSMTALFFGGQYESVGVTALLILAGIGLASLPTHQGSRGGKRRKIKISTR